MLDTVPYPTMRALEKFNTNNDIKNSRNSNNNNTERLYPNVSQIMICFIEKQPYEQVEPVWKSYCKFSILIFFIKQ